MARKSDSSAVKVVKKIPTTENGPGTRCTTTSGQVYLITQCLEKCRFTLWHEISGGFEQIATAKSPLDLDEKIPWQD